MNNEVELRFAWVFTCNECGRDTFINGIAPDYQPDEIEEIKESMDVPRDVDSTLFIQPEEVVCRYCQKKYEVVPPDTDF